MFDISVKLNLSPYGKNTRLSENGPAIRIFGPKKSGRRMGETIQ
jgi:hypothetical protein